MHSVYAHTLNMFICFPKTFLFPKKEHELILRSLRERVGNFQVDEGCKQDYIKQYLIKAEENLALSVSFVNDKILFTCCITASLFQYLKGVYRKAGEVVLQGQVVIVQEGMALN